MNRPTGFLHWTFPAMIALAAVSVFLSGRDLTLSYEALSSLAPSGKHPAVIWLQRGVSLLLLLASAERMLHHLVAGNRVPTPMLAVAFVMFWTATVLVPAYYGSKPVFAHDYIYSLVAGLAILLVSPQERDKIIDATRSALFLFMLAGVLMIPINFNMVLDPGYRQGLIPGLPRMGGLANHPVALGMLAQIALMCLWGRPFQRRWLNRAAWALGLFVLFMAQSKSAWIAFLICALAVAMVRRGGIWWKRVGDPTRTGFGLTVSLGFGILVALAFGLVVFGNIGYHISGFFDSREGAELASMTGRDRIWVVALEEWQNNRLFGYGPAMWDSAFRASIDMPFATHAHNQFVDTLGRSGLVGATALVLYAIVLLVLSIARARQTRGLSLALFLSIALLSVSEVPLLMLGYGNDLVFHLLLVATVAASPTAAARTVATPIGSSGLGVA